MHWACRTQSRSTPRGAAHRADHILLAVWASGSHDLRIERHQKDIFCISREILREESSGTLAEQDWQDILLFRKADRPPSTLNREQLPDRLIQDLRLS